jgi:hypothetical protein
MNGGADLGEIGVRMSFNNVNANERHGIPLIEPVPKAARGG